MEEDNIRKFNINQDMFQEGDEVTVDWGRVKYNKHNTFNPTKIHHIDCLGIEVFDGRNSEYGGKHVEHTAFISKSEILKGAILTISKTKTNNIMSTLKQILKKLTRTEPEKTFIEVGFLDESEEVTTMGREALEHILWEQNKDELKKLADKIKEDKE